MYSGGSNLDSDIIWIVVLIIGLIGTAIQNHFKKKKKKEINFDEFSNINEIKAQEQKEKEQMEHESAVLSHVFNETYNKSIDNAMYDKDGKYRPDRLTDYDIAKAYSQASKETEKARQDLENFQFLDSVKSEKETFKEGSKINALKENGYNFDIDLFKKWCVQIFGCIKIGSVQQLNVVKNFISDPLFQKYEIQAKNFAKDGLEFVTEDLIVENCYIYDYGRGISSEEIKVLINASMKEYIIRKSTGEVLRGDKENSYEKNVIMTFEKKNSNNPEGALTNCPSCGAPLSQTTFGRCSYCHTLLLPIRYNWTLTKFETL